MGQDLAIWRRLRGLTAAQVAERAGIARNTLRDLETGRGTVSLENFLRVARALGILDALSAATDPYSTDIGRLRAEERLPERVRPPRPGGSDG
jgi:transcriptional regulator with XRE-family HTH domain